MKFDVVDSASSSATTESSLYFPENEWKWLRKPVPTRADFEGPDEFLWAARVGDRLWAWHPLGSRPSANLTKIPVLTLEPTSDSAAYSTAKSASDELTAFGLYIKTTFRALPPQEIEWVNALDVLLNRLKFDPSVSGLPPYWKEALLGVGMEPHLGILSQRSRFLFLNQRERQLLFNRRWDPSVFEIIESWAPMLRSNFLDVIEKWNLSASQAKEVSSSIVILFKKLGDLASEKFLKKNFASPEEFRQSLAQLAQPELAALSAARIEKLRALRVPARTAVFGDPTFESDTLKIVHTPRSYGDYQIFKSWVEDPSIELRIKELLEIYRC